VATGLIVKVVTSANAGLASIRPKPDIAANVAGFIRPELFLWLDKVVDNLVQRKPGTGYVKDTPLPWSLALAIFILSLLRLIHL
jgi:hypothetical protein